MSIDKAIILSAGQGSRLLPLTRDIPKCLIEFNGRSLISWQVAALVANGVTDIVVVTGFRTERVEDHALQLYRDTGARIRLISDGDVAGAISAARPDSGTDLLVGIGGTPEGIIAAAAMRCMGGVLQARLAPTDDAERQKAIDAGHDLDRILTTERPSRGTFATLLSVALTPDTGQFDVVRAGHPGLLMHGTGTVDWLEPTAGPALGLGAREWPVNRLQLRPGDGLMLLTDGLFEGPAGDGGERLGEEGLLAAARSLARLPGTEFVKALISEVETWAEPYGGLTDDIAVIRVERSVR